MMRPWAFAYAFYYGTMPGCIGTWFAVAPCLTLTGGIAVRSEEGKVPIPEAAIRFASDTEVSIAKLERELLGDGRG